MSTLRVNAVVDAAGANNATVNGALPVPPTSTQLAKAWVNFNGTGTVAIRSSYNVSSITDNGTGNYTVNFTSAMTDANYAAVASSKGNDNTTDQRWYATQPCEYLTGSVRLRTTAPTSGSVTDPAAADAALVNLAIFR